jgi:hypothetical protein
MVMINEILLSVKTRIESVLQAAQPRDRDWIRLTNISGIDGNVQQDIAGNLVMSVASIQHDTSLGAYQQPRLGSDNSYGLTSAPMFFDVHVLFASCLMDANYATGLALLSRIIEYLQEYPVFDAASAPEIGERMGSLAAEYVSQDVGAASHLATYMGLKGQPYLLYRLRRLPFAGAAIGAVTPAVQRTPPPLLRPTG